MEYIAIGLLVLLVLLVLVLILRRPVVSNDNKALKDDINRSLIDFNRALTKSAEESRFQISKDFNEYKDNVNTKLQDQFKNINEVFAKRMDEINKKVEDRLNLGFEKSNKTFEDIVKRMAIIDKAQENIITLSTDMRSLQNILAGNQTRGGFGEHQLYQILDAAYGDNPKLYQRQYTIKKGKGEEVKADAVIFLPAPHKLVCIDSKFPYASYQQLIGEHTQEEEIVFIKDFAAAVKKHVDDISEKYVIPGTTSDYAIMFVPSDGVLALIHSKCPNIVAKAQEKNVLIVSPTTLFPLLHTYHIAYIDEERNKNVKEISSQIQTLNKEFSKFGGEWNKINNSIESLYRQGGDFDKRVGRISNKFDKIKTSDFAEIENEDGEDNV